MARYLLTVTDDDAARLERWLGFRLVITPATGISHGVPVVGLAAVTDREAARSELSKLLGELWRNNPVDRSALAEILRAADVYAAAGGPG